MSWKYIGFGGTGKLVANLVSSLMRLGFGKENHVLDFAGGAVVDLDWDAESRDAVFEMKGAKGAAGFFAKAVPAIVAGNKSKAKDVLLEGLRDENGRRISDQKLEHVLSLLFGTDELGQDVHQGCFGMASLGGAIGHRWIDGNLLEEGTIPQGDKVVMVLSSIGGTGAGMGPQAMELLLRRWTSKEKGKDKTLVLFVLEKYVEAAPGSGVGAENVEQARSDIHERLERVLKASDTAARCTVFYVNDPEPQSLSPELKADGFMPSFIPLAVANAIVNGSLFDQVSGFFKADSAGAKKGYAYGRIWLGGRGATLETYTLWGGNEQYVSRGELCHLLGGVDKVFRTIRDEAKGQRSKIPQLIRPLKDALGGDALTVANEMDILLKCSSYLARYVGKVTPSSGRDKEDWVVGMPEDLVVPQAKGAAGLLPFSCSRKLTHAILGPSPKRTQAMPNEKNCFASDQPTEAASKQQDDIVVSNVVLSQSDSERTTTGRWFSSKSYPFRMARWFADMVKKQGEGESVAFDFVGERKALLRQAATGYFRLCTVVRAFGEEVVLVENGPYVVGAIHPVHGPWFPVCLVEGGALSCYSDAKHSSLMRSPSQLVSKCFEPAELGITGRGTLPGLRGSGIPWSCPWGVAGTLPDGAFNKDKEVPIAKLNGAVVAVLDPRPWWDHPIAANELGGGAIRKALQWFIDELSTHCPGCSEQSYFHFATVPDRPDQMWLAWRGPVDNSAPMILGLNREQLGSLKRIAKVSGAQPAAAAEAPVVVAYGKSEWRFWFE